jgi:HSP20 family protein
MSIRDLVPWGRHERDRRPQRGAADAFLALQSEVGGAFEDFWRTFDVPSIGAVDGGLVPRVDVREGDDAVEVVAELPGVEERNLDVRLSEGLLTLRGAKAASRESEQGGYVLRECSVGRFERAVPLPAGLDPDSAQAKFQNGVLTVRIPRATGARSTARRIPVKSGEA